ncbi:hypothetical protein SPRG_17163 [Saprolegnia parasitica CBS 223.65]|uniref:Selenoprotein F/M domain-containing protein n=1 Tax=Saprolegnia parasitica (strain CBS 223.65) TaxID=695850 RepID=A0A067BT00_SAPPC|nr:hypothetical protein SPRG_17163 [Saprolegnia parasitica CBS 223.65]KDO17416.1 hypothetical protein SPRG_17163 [Saprolegnia parasitica CBS 223.65]|eukprot:XP_012211873.1 hypothetical protein SPRG_17163 [Saprolegnia parasitica CBS 223.65]
MRRTSILTALVGGALAAVLTRDECTSLGLDAAAIDCDSCRDDGATRGDCLECCTPRTTYASAQLRNHGQWSLPGFSVQYEHGQKPQLLFYDSAGAMQTKVEVESWKEGSIRDYVALLLAPNRYDRDEL